MFNAMRYFQIKSNQTMRVVYQDVLFPFYRNQGNFSKEEKIRYTST